VEYMYMGRGVEYMYIYMQCNLFLSVGLIIRLKLQTKYFFNLLSTSYYCVFIR